MLNSVNVTLHTKPSVILRISSKIREQSVIPTEMLHEKLILGAVLHQRIELKN